MFNMPSQKHLIMLTVNAQYVLHCEQGAVITNSYCMLVNTVSLP